MRNPNPDTSGGLGTWTTKDASIFGEALVNPSAATNHVSYPRMEYAYAVSTSQTKLNVKPACHWFHTKSMVHHRVLAVFFHVFSIPKTRVLECFALETIETFGPQPNLIFSLKKKRTMGSLAQKN